MGSAEMGVPRMGVLGVAVPISRYPKMGVLGMAVPIAASDGCPYCGREALANVICISIHKSL